MFSEKANTSTGVGMTVERTTYVRNLSQWLYHKQSPFPGAWLAPLQLPGIRGMWTPTGPNILDMTSHGGDLANYNSSILVDQSTTWPGVAYLYASANPAQCTTTCASNPQLNIMGALTLGGWFSPVSPTTEQLVVGTANSAFGAYLDPAYIKLKFITSGGVGIARFSIENGGVTYAADSAEIAISRWHFIVGRFQPSTKVSILTGSTWVDNAAGIPASIASSAGIYFGLLDGRASGAAATRLAQAWACAYAVPDHALTWLYKTQLSLFGG
jgi:hypothetical protein